MYTVQLREEAGDDLATAAFWYEQQQPGLGHQFLEEAVAAFRRISRHPFSYPVVHRDTRRALMHRFPFGVFYRVRNGIIIVLAVMHGSRHPKRWQGRP